MLLFFLVWILLTTQEYEYIKLQTKGTEFLNDKNWGDALYELKQAIKKSPQNAIPHLRIGELYQQRILYSISIPHLEKAKKLQSTLKKKECITLYLYLASAYHHTQKMEQEKENLEKLLELSVSSKEKQGFCNLGLGLLYLQNEDYEKAKEYLLKSDALEYRPRKTYLALAKTFSKLRLQEAPRVERQKYMNLGRHYLYLYKNSFLNKNDANEDEKKETKEMMIDIRDLENILEIPVDKPGFIFKSNP